ncbi:zinc ribbon domain-containing protein [Apilactobacillus apisilvae]|uniref:Zinc ribbon domain-containing protein n=1 Tax=Apilactobacillus apisilvae TaxID=2923364 RepID=A0ABY4PGI0_9LACO|nr:zinc ribbon domain-containing protein [Apilactobacillus apisilvae]UQS84919.1 zinc ribbon domain-containing protein [Apilactobacillus apisilvae]
MKKCPKCGASVDSNSKFCTNCGYSFINDQNNQMNNQSKQNNTQDNINQNVESMKKYSNGYFSWFMKTIKKPSEEVKESHTYYGLTSFIVSAILIAFTMYHSFMTISSLLGDTFGSVLGNNISDNVSYFDCLITVLILIIVWILIGFLAKKFSSKNKIGFFEYLNKLSNVTNYIIIIDLLLSILVLVSSSYLAYALVFLFITLIIPVAYNIGLSLILFEHSNSKIDEIYMVLGTIIADLLAVLIIFKLFS